MLRSGRKKSSSSHSILKHEENHPNGFPLELATAWNSVEDRGQHHSHRECGSTGSKNRVAERGSQVAKNVGQMGVAFLGTLVRNTGRDPDNPG